MEMMTEGNDLEQHKQIKNYLKEIERREKLN
jgi:hypothetical protein